ncbi:gephyrin-like molybdotransferase Glp [Actinomycetaceae bacterium MB13-C1-2]|nr:gephyrin-like molybdotransferase Glp [Actinomycetaceae bacterium MB13-C1-2]
MHSVAQFYQDCLSVAQQQPPLDMLLADAMGCILAEDVVAPFNHPIVNVAACDGYAVVASDIASAAASPVSLRVTAEVASGSTQALELTPGTAVRIGSGAPLPSGADVVIPLALADLKETVVVISRPWALGTNVRSKAEDFVAGEPVLRAGTRLGPVQIAALAAVGRARVVVHPNPRVVILSIGDELVEPGVPPHPGTVFDTNGHMLAAAANEVGVETYRVAAVPDDAQRLKNLIEDQLMRADLIITTGGLSFGSGDTVRQVLEELGDVAFERVAIRPGNMLGVGTVGEEFGRAVPVYCLPGDPVAAQVCFEVFVRPALRKMQGWTKLNRAAVRGVVDRSFASPAGIREFIRVRLTGSPREGYTATVVGEPEALWLSALATSNALAVIPEEVEEVSAGDQVTCLLLEQ